MGNYLARRARFLQGLGVAFSHLVKNRAHRGIRHCENERSERFNHAATLNLVRRHFSAQFWVVSLIGTFIIREARF